MQVPSATLLAAQKAVGDVICKAVLISGATTKTYGVATTNRLLDLRYRESEWSQTAQVVVDNRDGNLTALTLEGYTATISFGYNTSEGDEYKAKPPLTVIAQKADSLQGEAITAFSCAGVFNMMGEDKASAAYIPDTSDTKTVKDLLDAIAGDNTRSITMLACFNHCPTYTVTYDTEDSLIDTFQPKDTFRVYINGTRLAAFKRMLSYVGCKARIESDGAIHVFVPTPYAADWEAETAYSEDDKVKPTTPNGFEYICTTAGTSDTAGNEPTWPTTEDSTVAESPDTLVWTIVWYDYEYNDAVTEHNFFDKSVRTRLVLPNKVIVMSHPDHDETYTNSAADAASYAALGNQYYPETHYIRATGNAQCGTIAAAILQHHQIAREKGHVRAPMNCGQEVMDYVKVTDSRLGDTRVGSIGYIESHYAPTTFEFEFRFGSIELGHRAGTLAPTLATEKANYASLHGMVEELMDLCLQIGDYLLANAEETHWKDTTIYVASSSPVDETRLWLDTSGTPNVWKVYDTGEAAWIKAYPTDIDEIEDGTTYARVKTTDISAGHILLTECTGDLDDIADGDTYDKVLATQISAGKIHLSSALSFATGYDPSHKIKTFYQDASPTAEGTGDLWVDTNDNNKLYRWSGSAWTEVPPDLVNAAKSGEWYNASGVEIDATHGINIYGTASALTTRATKAGTVQCYVGADGYIYAGAGAVFMSAAGLTLKGGKALKLYNQDGGYVGELGVEAGAGTREIFLDAYVDLNLLSDDEIRIAAGLDDATKRVVVTRMNSDAASIGSTLDTPSQNNTNKLLFVTLTFRLDADEKVAIRVANDSTPDASTEVASCANYTDAAGDIEVPVSFLVPVGWYWLPVVADGTPTLVYESERTIG